MTRPDPADPKYNDTDEEWGRPKLSLFRFSLAQDAYINHLEEILNKEKVCKHCGESLCVGWACCSDAIGEKK